MKGNNVISYKISAWREGWQAFEDGQPQTSNPYEQFSAEFLEWLEGWEAAWSEAYN